MKQCDVAFRVPILHLVLNDIWHQLALEALSNVDVTLMTPQISSNVECRQQQHQLFSFMLVV